MSEIGSAILIEAEDFQDFGGWSLDSQFEQQMGSPYLLAHGLGTPVADARTTFFVTEAGTYTVWVRAKDWVPSHHPGRFTLGVSGTELSIEFGSNGQDWMWQEGGTVNLQAGENSLVLHDLTGFDGRCDAIFLSNDGSKPVEGAGSDARAWRKQLRGLPAQPVASGEFDVVVVGGGVAGCAAALTASNHGCRVALVQDRPVLGGNASKEIGLSPRGDTGGLVKMLTERTPDGDIVAFQLLKDAGVSVFLEHRVFDAVTDGARLVSIDIREARSGQESRLGAPMFIDCTGTAILGILTGAETMSGQESKAEFGEPLAPEERDDMHHGNTLFFRTRMASHPVDFPEVPWAVEIAKDYANLSGQLQRPGTENGDGPIAGQNPDRPEFDFAKAFAEAKPGENPLMKFPATHFWEYGQWLDLYTQGEHIRDYLMRALYGTMSNVKKLDPVNYANLEFDWMAYVAAQGEFKRYKGDHVLTEMDIRDHVQFEDAVVNNDGAFCIHCANKPGEGEYNFRLKDWIWDVRDNLPYAIPFRCLYSVNVDNLMMAGKHISVTHIAGTSTKFIGNGVQHGTAVGVAAALCKKYGTTPRGIYQNHIGELQEITEHLVGHSHE
jgi:hypothetical protein